MLGQFKWRIIQVGMLRGFHPGTSVPVLVEKTHTERALLLVSCEPRLFVIILIFFHSLSLFLSSLFAWQPRQTRCWRLRCRDFQSSTERMQKTSRHLQQDNLEPWWHFRVDREIIYKNFFSPKPPFFNGETQDNTLDCSKGYLKKFNLIDNLFTHPHK